MMLQKTRFFLFYFAAVLMISLFPLRVQAALSREIPAAPVKFLTDAYLTRNDMKNVLFGTIYKWYQQTFSKYSTIIKP